MKHLENYNTHSTFTCEDCLQEKSTFYESFQKNNTCEDCFNEQAICDRCNEEMKYVALSRSTDIKYINIMK